MLFRMLPNFSAVSCTSPKPTLRACFTASKFFTNFAVITGPVSGPIAKSCASIPAAEYAAPIAAMLLPTS
ncbi:hypothetical protein D3C78_1838680 [compost metagenome]